MTQILNKTSIARAFDLDGPTLSVIVPNRDHCALLRRALEALLAQTSSPDEIIVIDDASTDGSPALIEAMARQHPTIRPFFETSNKGTVALMNRGLELARGKYIAFAASDDYTEPNFLGLAIETLEASPEAAFFSAETRLATPEGKFLGVRPIAQPSGRTRYFAPADVSKLLQSLDQFVSTSSVVFCKERLVAAGGFDPELRSMADTHTARHLALAHGFCFAPIVVGTLTIRESSYSRSAVHDPRTTLELIARGRAAIVADPIHPPGYSDLFERRFRFAACRLAMTETINWRDFVLVIGARDRLDRAILHALSSLPTPFGRFGTLAWLTLRLRPYSVVQVGLTALRRRFGKPGRQA